MCQLTAISSSQQSNVDDVRIAATQTIVSRTGRSVSVDVRQNDVINWTIDGSSQKFIRITGSRYEESMICGIGITGIIANSVGSLQNIL